MDKMTRLEYLSNEIFFEIFDYLNALDILMGFSSLNQRLSSILSSIHLRIVVSSFDCRRQMERLSLYLIDHAYQVISVCLDDSICDLSSVISFFFTRHTFVNLQFCAFYSYQSSLQLQNVIQQLESLTKLRSFRLIVANDVEFCDTEKQNLSKTILTHKSSELRSIELAFHYNHSHLTTAVTLNWKLTSLTLTFYGLPHKLTIYCFLPVLRIYRALRRLRVRVSIPTTPDIKHA
jgi:hypothetical protein